MKYMMGAALGTLVLGKASGLVNALDQQTSSAITPRRRLTSPDTSILYKLDIGSGAFPSDVLVQEDPSNGATCNFVTDIARAGGYAAKCTVTNQTPVVPTGNQSNKAMINLLNLRPPSHAAIPEAYWGFSFYLPSTLSVPDWLMLLEIQQKHGDADWPIIVDLKMKHSPPRLYTEYNCQGQGVQSWEDTEPLALGQWHDFVVYLNMSQTGQVKIWMDGRLKADLSYNTLVYNDPPAPYPLIGCYQSPNNPPNWIGIDKSIVASTLEGAIS